MEIIIDPQAIMAMIIDEGQIRVYLNTDPGDYLTFDRESARYLRDTLTNALGEGAG